MTGNGSAEHSACMPANLALSSMNESMADRFWQVSKYTLTLYLWLVPIRFLMNLSIVKS